MEAESWFESKPVNEVTITELNDLCMLCFDQRKKVDEMNDVIKEEEAKLKELQTKIIEYLNATGHTTWKTDKGAVTCVERWAVTLPKADEDKKAFFDYLKQRGSYDSLITVNSRTLQGFYREEQEEAVRGGAVQTELDFKMPGISAPTLVQTLSMKKR